jgi:hypothetical protein
MYQCGEVAVATGNETVGGAIQAVPELDFPLAKEMSNWHRQYSFVTSPCARRLRSSSLGESREVRDQM